MPDLLRAAVEAHGGLSRWNQLNAVKASLSITGAIWQLKGKPDDHLPTGGDGKFKGEGRRSERRTSWSEPLF